MNKEKRFFYFFAVFVLFCMNGMAQNVSSPYSIIGIGDLETTEYGRYSSTGSASAARRDDGYYNFSNPASLTSLTYKNVNLNMFTRGRISNYKIPGVDTIAGPSKDFIVKSISLAYKVTPKTAFAVGLKPFSSVNYQYTTNSSLNNDYIDYIKYTDGSGGIYQTYISLAKEFGKHFSAGITGSWLFGSLHNSVEYYNSNLALDVIKLQTNYYSGAGVQGGIQYYTDPKKKWQHNFGLTTSLNSKLNGYNTTQYFENDTLFKKMDDEDISFKMPATFSAAYSLFNKNGFSFHLQGDYQKWGSQQTGYSKILIRDAAGFSGGVEYSSRIKAGDFYFEKYYLALGVRTSQSYLVLNGNRVNDFAFTFGAGKNLSRIIGVNMSMEAGKKGLSSLNQIRENYFQFSLGLTLKDIWYGTRKFGRYD